MKTEPIPLSQADYFGFKRSLRPPVCSLHDEVNKTQLLAAVNGFTIIVIRLEDRRGMLKRCFYGAIARA